MTNDKTKKILVTGGTGRLATELKKHLEGEYVGIEMWDFIFQVPPKQYDLILHLGAYTDVKHAEQEQDKCFHTNVTGTFNLSKAYKDTPIIYFSTEYARNPIGVYAKTKRWAEEIIIDHTAPHLVIRSSFKPTPFPYPYAYENQYTQGDYVDVIAELLAKRVLDWNFESGFEYLGTGRKTMFELAQRTRPDVLPNRVEDYIAQTGAPIPFDYE